MKITDLNNYTVIAPKPVKQEEETTAIGTAKDLAIGFAKGVGSTVKGAADLGRLATDPLLGALDPNKTIADYKAGVSPITDEMVTAKNKTQAVGKGIEIIAEFLIPIGKGTKLGQVAKSGVTTAATNATKIASSAKNILPKSDEIMQRVARISAGDQVKFQQTAGESVGEYLTKRNIYGDSETIAKKLFDRFQTSKNTADNAIAQLPGRYKADQIKSALDALKDKVISTSAPGAPDADLSKIISYVEKYDTKGLNMTEINDVKRLFERNVKLDFVRSNLPTEIKKATNIDNAIRSWQFKKAESLGLKNLPEINKETQLARQLMDSLGKTEAARGGNNAISLTDWILLAGGDPTAVGAYFTKKVLSSKGLQSSLAKKLYTGTTKGNVIPVTSKGADKAYKIPIKTQ